MTNTIISNNTVWTAGSQHTLTGNIQIAYGATLTIQPGATVDGKGVYKIEVGGSLNVAGADASRVHLTGVDVVTLNNTPEKPASISIDRAVIDGGTILPPTGNAAYEHLTLAHSVVENASAYTYLWYPVSATTITANLFVNAPMSLLDMTPTIAIAGNTFVNSPVTVIANYSNAITFSGNSLVAAGSPYVLISELPEGHLAASSNWFGTTSTAAIMALVWDSGDDLNLGSITIAPPLSAAPAGAPLVGTSGADKLIGHSTADLIYGGAGNDWLIGGLGSDWLVGGPGADRFYFYGALGPTNINEIADFSSTQHDKIALDNAVFTALGELTGVMMTGNFLSVAAGHAATTLGQHVIYDRADGSLWYDQDGNKPGGHAAIEFAVLDAHPATISAADFLIV